MAQNFPVDSESRRKVRLCEVRRLELRNARRALRCSQTELARWCRVPQAIFRASCDRGEVLRLEPQLEQLGRHKKHERISRPHVQALEAGSKDIEVGKIDHIIDVLNALEAATRPGQSWPPIGKHDRSHELASDQIQYETGQKSMCCAIVLGALGAGAPSCDNSHAVQHVVVVAPDFRRAPIAAQADGTASIVIPASTAALNECGHAGGLNRPGDRPLGGAPSGARPPGNPYLALTVALACSLLCAWAAPALLAAGHEDGPCLRTLQFIGVYLVAWLIEKDSPGDRSWLDRLLAPLPFVSVYSIINWIIGLQIGEGGASALKFFMPDIGVTANSVVTMVHSGAVVFIAFLFYRRRFTGGASGNECDETSPRGRSPSPPAVPSCDGQLPAKPAMLRAMLRIMPRAHLGGYR